MPVTASAKTGLARLGIMTPIVLVRAVLRLRPMPCGRKPSSWIAARTRSAVSDRVTPRSLMTRDTVAIETPARAATSLTVGADLSIGMRGCYQPGVTTERHFENVYSHSRIERFAAGAVAVSFGAGDREAREC